MQGMTEIELPSGFQLLAFTVELNRPERGVVLAYRPAGERMPTDEEWVTWVVFRNEDQPSRWGTTCWGHYHDNVEDAWNDWIDRAMNPRIVALRRIEPDSRRA